MGGFRNWMTSASPKPDPSKPHPCNMPQAKTEVALQFSECCAAETALQHWLFCSAEVIWTKSCAAANEKLHCNIEKAALQESGAFLPLSCGFQAPTFRHPRFGPADDQRCWRIRERSPSRCDRSFCPFSPQNAAPALTVSQVALQRCNVNFLARFLGWILEGEFWEVNFSTVNFSGGLFSWKK